MKDGIFVVESFLAFTTGIIVYFVGMRLTQRIQWLRGYNIPEPVTGGIFASLAALGIYLCFDIQIEYQLQARDTLLVYFFTCIGLNARLSDLISGGRPLIILLVLTLAYIVIQDVVGVATARLIGQSDAMGILTGSASLIGGHGTAIAWAPVIAEKHGVTNALEIGVASATVGLILASLLGGPVAKFLLSRHELNGNTDEIPVVGVSHSSEDTESFDHINVMSAILTIHIAVIIGHFLNLAFAAIGLRLPLFVSCLIVAIVMSNTVPRILPNIRWPARTKTLAVVSDFSLGLFISMSLMAMQLWSVANLAGPLLVLLAAQAIAAVLFVLLVLFRAMGKDYTSAVLSSGFVGFSLGATPTAIANMTAVTKSHGPAPTAFIILPLVGAFFVDITNAFIIQFMLR